MAYVRDEQSVASGNVYFIKQPFIHFNFFQNVSVLYPVASYHFTAGIVRPVVEILGVLHHFAIRLRDFARRHSDDFIFAFTLRLLYRISLYS
jgi:hypothetical protein